MDTPNKALEFSAADVKTMTLAIDELFAKTGVLFNKNQFSDRPESIAATEAAQLNRPEQYETICSMAIFSMESAADHLAAFTTLLEEPAKTLAPFTCLRSLMETSALACWLFDPAISAEERLGRTFARRYSELLEQRKIFNFTKDKLKLDKVNARIDKVEKDAIAAGFAEVLDKNNDRLGIGRRPPTIVELLGDTCASEYDYRLLSAVAHGQMWASHQVGFRLIEHELDKNKKIKALTKAVVPNFAVYFGMVAVLSFSRVLVNMWTILGWDMHEIIELLEITFDKLGYSEAIRFWREPA